MKEIEYSKRILSILINIQNRKDFNIHEIFHIIKGYSCINTDDLKNFLNKNSINVLNSDINSILKRLDFNRDGRIDLAEFHLFFGFPRCAYCCPCTQCQICGTAYCEKCFCEAPCFIHNTVHHNFQCTHDNDCNCEKNNNYSNQDTFINITNNPNFNNPNCNFNSPNNDFNNFNNNFNNSNNNFNSFSNNFISNTYTSKNFNQEDIKNNNSNYNTIMSQERNISPSLSLRKSPQREYGPQVIGQCNICGNDPCKCCPNCKNYPCQCGNNSFSNNPNLNQANLVNNFNRNQNWEQKLFSDILIKLMEVELELEFKKQQLSEFEDFNCEDVFRIFEINGKGFILPQELKKGLELLNISQISDFDIRLFMKRFDLQKKGKIIFADFFDIIVPFEVESRNKVEGRKPNSNSAQNVNVFSNETKNKLSDVLSTILMRENEINVMRKKFGSLILDVKKIFDDIDFNRKGYFEINDFIMYLKKNYLYGNSVAADLLFIRLDKNRNGRIELKEVEDEIKSL